MIHLLVYISTAAAAVLSIIQAGKQILPWIAGIVVYVLAAVLLTLSCVFFYHDLRENVIKKILEVIKKNPLGERFLADYCRLHVSYHPYHSACIFDQCGIYGV